MKDFIIFLYTANILRNYKSIFYLFETLPSPYLVDKAAQHIIKSNDTLAVAATISNLEYEKK